MKTRQDTRKSSKTQCTNKHIDMEESVEATPSLIHSAGWINPLSLPLSLACLIH